MASARPLWDIIADFTTGPPNLPTSSSVSLNSQGSITQAWEIRRGRQYELGNAEAGALSVAVFDPKENLNPVNGGAPWNSGGNSLLPYRCIQVGAWWSKTTNDRAGNLLNSTNTIPGSTSTYDPSFESGASGWFAAAGSPTLAQSTAQAFNGTHSLAVTFTSSSDVAEVAIRQPAGQTFALSVYVFAPASHTVTATWANFPGSVGTAIGTVTSSTTGVWQRLTITGVPAYPYSVLRLTGSGTYSQTTYVDATQLEIGSSASTFTTAGPTYFPRYTGYIERYPQTWVDAGFRGMRPLEAVDALSVLSRTVINQSYAATIAADNPYAIIPFSDAATPLVVQMPQGGQPFLGGVLIGNTSGSVNFAGDTFLDGSSAMTVVQQNANPVISGNTTYVTYAIARNGILYMNPKGFTIEVWVKVTSGTAYIGAAAIQPGESVTTAVLGPSDQVGWYTGQGSLQLNYLDPNGSASALFRIGNGGTYGGFPDGQWHHLVLIFPDGSHVRSVVDGVAGGLGNISGTPSQSIGLNGLYVEATTYFGDPITQVSAANMAIYPSALSTTRAIAHYNRGSGYLGELAGARVARLLAAYWSATNYTAAPGITQLAPDFSYDPAGSAQSARTVLDVLQEISNTENSFLWANTAGVVVWEDRSTRAAKQTSTATLGNGAGQIHFEDLEYDYDPTYVYSQANLSRPANSSYPPQTNTTSLGAYGQRILSVTLQVNSDYDLSQAAAFYLNRYAAPGGAPGTGTAPRIRKITLNPSADPTMWNFVLALDLSQRITVTFATSAGVTITGDYYVENIAESHNPADITHTVDLQLSPVFVPTAWVLGDSTYGVLGTTTVPVY